MTETASPGPRLGRDYDSTPLYVTWQVTMACGLGCQYCRTDARPVRHSNELSTDEGKALLDDVAGFGDPNPIMTFSGGDPLERPDLNELIEHAISVGLPTTVRVAPTAQLDRAVLETFAELGVGGVSLPLDGATEDDHDEFRGVSGMYDRVLRTVDWTDDLDVPTQIETIVTATTADRLPDIADLVDELGVAIWELVFARPSGSETRFDVLSPERIERVLEWLHRCQVDASFNVTTVAAPHYQRIARNNLSGQVKGERSVPATGDGKGCVFIDALGDVYPSEFLPLRIDNVCESDIVSIYRDSEFLKTLRDADALQGPCRRCSHAAVCGGSRARGFAMTGNPLASDPLCIHTGNLNRSD